MFLRSRHKIISLGFLHLMLILGLGCKTSYVSVQSNSDHIQVESSADSAEYSLTDAFLAPYRQKLQDSFSTVIATTTADFVKRRPGGSLGNLVTTAVWYFMKNNTPGTSSQPPAMLVLMNYGGIRLKEIPIGDITIGKIFELLPFENTLVRIQIKGADLKKLLFGINESGGWPMKFFSKRIPSLEKMNNQQYFELITNNYIAAGGDNCTILKTLPQEDTGILLRDIVIDYLRKQKTITPDETDYILK